LPRDLSFHRKAGAEYRDHQRKLRDVFEDDVTGDRVKARDAEHPEADRCDRPEDQVEDRRRIRAIVLSRECADPDEQHKPEEKQTDRVAPAEVKPRS
jgi:hypothetical protein